MGIDESNKKKSTVIDFMRFFAILSVICAHCKGLQPDDSHFSRIVESLIVSTGTIGVCVFFFITGGLLATSSKIREGFAEFLFVKFKRIVPPWILWGTTVYLYVVIRKGGLSAVSWFEFLLGRGSYLYYLSMLVVYYFMGYLLLHASSFQLLNAILIAMSIAFNIVTEIGIVSVKIAALNPLNWYVYFGMGMTIFMVCKNDIYRKDRKWRAAVAVLALIAAVLLVFTSIRLSPLNYWSYGFFGFGLCAIGLVYVVSYIISSKKSRFIKTAQDIGSETLFIYLAHMPIAGILANITSRFDIWVLTFVSPAVVLSITYFGLLICRKICVALNLQRVSQAIGIAKLEKTL